MKGLQGTINLDWSITVNGRMIELSVVCTISHPRGRSLFSWLARSLGIDSIRSYRRTPAWCVDVYACLSLNPLPSAVRLPAHQDKQVQFSKEDGYTYGHRVSNDPRLDGCVVGGAGTGRRPHVHGD